MDYEQAIRNFQEYKKKMHISLGISLSMNAIAIALAILSFFV